MNKIYEEISKELNLPKYLVEKIARHAFKFTKSIMEEGKMDGIMIPKLGKFIVKQRQYEKLIKHGKTPHIQNNESLHEGTSN